MGMSAPEQGESASAFQAIVAAPGFALGVRCSQAALTELCFLAPQPAQAPVSRLAEDASEQITRWLEDPDVRFTLPLQPAGTAFQRRVWDEISAIPRGETRFYGQLALRLKNAPRAVGQACGANPYPLIVPCHRVIAAHGGLGGFNRHGGGFLLDIKRWLLGHEGALAS